MAACAFTRLEPADSPTLRTGHKVGKHRIQGVSDEFIPALVHLDELDHIVDVRDGDAILMAQALGRTLGLGRRYLVGRKRPGGHAARGGPRSDATVVTILPDSNKKYLSTDLCHDEPSRVGDLTPCITLESFAAIPCPP